MWSASPGPSSSAYAAVRLALDSSKDQLLNGG